MKAIKFLLATLLFAMVISCNSNPTTPQNDETPTITVDEAPVELEVRTVYGPDSSYKTEFQVNAVTNQKHGWYKEYTEQGQLFVERNYQNNKAEGVEKMYYPSGKVEKETTFKNGEYDGVFKYYYEDGTLKQEGTYTNNQMEGLLKTYYADGALKEEVTLVANLTEGPFKEYNPNGTIKTEGTYTSVSDREDLETGELKMYDENGVLAEKMMCKEGQCCTFWTQKDGEVKPSNKLCEAIIKNAQQ